MLGDLRSQREHFSAHIICAMMYTDSMTDQSNIFLETLCLALFDCGRVHCGTTCVFDCQKPENSN